LERVGESHVVQYRGEILPLLDVARAVGTSGGRFGPAGGTDADAVQVVVYAHGGRRVGLVVGSILDIVDEAIVTRADGNRPGVLSTAVVQGRVTEFPDMGSIVGKPTAVGIAG
jgi:two-component system chemotaxis sensor kinase CheA